MFLPKVIFQHHEEAGLSWIRYTGVDCFQGCSHYNKEDLAELRDTVEASLDGLRIAVRDGWDPFAEDVDEEYEISPAMEGEYFPLMVLAVESANEDWQKQCLKWAEDEDIVRDWLGALTWLPLETSKSMIAKSISSSDPLVKKAGVDALVAHGWTDTMFIEDLLAHSDAGVRASCLRGIGKMNLPQIPDLLGGLKDDDSNCRFWALWSLIMRGEHQKNPELLEMLDKFCFIESKLQLQAIHLRVRILDADTRQSWMSKLKKAKNGTRLTIQAMGWLGDPAFIEEIVAGMNAIETAPVAGEAFSMITGVDLLYDDLDLDYPEEHVFGPNDDADDDDTDMHEDEDLPLPNPQLLNAWWNQHGANFQNGKRYLCGEEISKDSCQRVSDTGFQRQRYSAKTEMELNLFHH